MDDAEVESAAEHRLGIFEGIDTAEIMPKAQRNGREKQSAAATAAVLHRVVARFVGNVGHISLFCTLMKEPKRAVHRITRHSEGYRSVALTEMLFVFAAGSGTRLPSIAAPSISRETWLPSPERCTSIW